MGNSHIRIRLNTPPPPRAPGGAGGHISFSTAPTPITRIKRYVAVLIASPPPINPPPHHHSPQRTQPGHFCTFIARTRRGAETESGERGTNLFSIRRQTKARTRSSNCSTRSTPPFCPISLISGANSELNCPPPFRIPVYTSINAILR